MNTLFDKIWDSHVVQQIADGPTQLYIDRLYCHEVTSPQAFDSLRQRGLQCFRPGQIYCMPDHNIPTHDQDKPIADPVSRTQVETLERNAAEFGLPYYGVMHPDNGIIHVVGPEKGLSLPGMTIVCGDSHTSTHGAMGAVAFGIGTSEVEMVMASQCVLQQKPKTMRITIDGSLGKGVTAKDMALYLMSQLTTSGATGYFVEYAGEAVRRLSMEGRLTLCNLSIEMGARGGIVAPDEVTMAYVKGRDFAPTGDAWDRAVAYWQTLKSDDDAVFDREYRFDAACIEPRITYGTNPGMGFAVGPHPHPGEHRERGPGIICQGAAIHGIRAGRTAAGSQDRLCLPRSLHQRQSGRLPRLRLNRQGPQASPRCGGVAGAWLVARDERDRGRGHRCDAARGGLRDTPTGVLGLSRHER